MLDRQNDSIYAEIRLLDERVLNERIYRLYRFEVDRHPFFVVYVNDGDQGCAEMISATEKQIMSLYDTICEGGLCAEHLTDIIRDAKSEQICKFL